MVTAVTRERAYFVGLALVLPLVLILIQIFTGLGGIVLLVAAVLWMGFAVLVLGALLGVE